MRSIEVSQGRVGYRFREPLEQRYIDIEGPGQFTRAQLRAVAYILGISESEEVAFLDAGNYETLAWIEPGPGSPGALLGCPTHDA